MIQIIVVTGVLILFYSDMDTIYYLITMQRNIYCYNEYKNIIIF
jgi:hypothetical protein